MSELTLHHYWRSSCSWRVRWALAIKNLEYKCEAVNLLAGEQKEAKHLTANPAGFVPALFVDGVPYGESIAIMEWLEETYPSPPLLPTSAADRLIVRQLTNIISSGTQPIQNLAVQARVSEDKSERIAWAKYWIERGLGAYETLLQQHAGTYSFGSNITMADLCLIPQVYNALRFDVAMNHFPKAQEIYDRCLELETCQAAHPDRFAP